MRFTNLVAVLVVGLAGLGVVAAQVPLAAVTDGHGVYGGGCYVNFDKDCPFVLIMPSKCSEIPCERVAEFDMCPENATEIYRLPDYPSTRAANPGERGVDIYRDDGPVLCHLRYSCASAGVGGAGCTDPSPSGGTYCLSGLGNYQGPGLEEWGSSVRGEVCKGRGVPNQ